MTSLQKQWENSDHCEANLIIYHLKGIDKSYPETLCHSVKLPEIYFKYTRGDQQFENKGHPCAHTKYGHVTRFYIYYQEKSL